MHKLTKQQADLIKRLEHKKYRLKEGLFVVEGNKPVKDLLGSTYKTVLVVATPSFLDQESQLLEKGEFDIFCATPAELARLSSFKSNNTLIAVARCQQAVPLAIGKGMRALVVDNVRDPGNLGAILRIADWYGIAHIICSPSTVEKYNPRVIRASMGSFVRVQVYYTALAAYLKKVQMPVIGAVMDGASLHHTALPKEGLLVVGNECAGISKALVGYMTHQITIPRYGSPQSLNVAMATAIICDHWLRA